MPVNGQLTKWALGALLAVVLFIGGLFAEVLDSRVSNNTARVNQVEQAVVRNESSCSNVSEQLDRIERTIDRIDARLDSHLIDSR